MKGKLLTSTLDAAIAANLGRPGSAVRQSMQPMQALHWSAFFVGIPWLPKGRSMAGCDCWGLVWTVQTFEFGRALPSYAEDYISPDEAREVTALIGREKHLQANWKPAVGAPMDGDILIFDRPGGMPHAGVAISRLKMLHMARETVSCIENFDAPQWAKRLTGVYRWQPEGGKE